MTDTAAGTPPRPQPDARTKAAMTLAGLAYGFPENLAEHLKDEQLASRGEWTATWVPGRETGGYFAFVAVNRPANRGAVAIRGTNPGPMEGFLRDVLDDVDVGVASPWAHPSVRDAAISRGAARGLDALLALDARGTPLLQHLDAILPDGTELWVTGHSLGGCLASVLALKLAERYAARGVRVELMTFAAPSAGNAAFARLVEDMLPMAQRWYNPLDLVPMAWHDLARLRQMYEAPGPRCPWLLSWGAGRISKKATKLGYTQPGTGSALPAVPSPPLPVPGFLSRLLRPFRRRRIFLLEAVAQHDPNTYLALMDAPQLPFRLPLPWLARELGFTGHLIS